MSSGSAAAEPAAPLDAAGDRFVRLAAEIRAGLTRPQKVLPSRLFYDRRGSELFEEITGLEEYYLTRTEAALLNRWADEWVRGTGSTALVELGAGSARKTRVLLDVLDRLDGGGLFVPVDVSEIFLDETTEALRREYPRLRVRPVVADFASPFDLPGALPARTLFALLGSTIGNFDVDSAVEVLRNLRRHMQPGHSLLLGVDLRPGRSKTLERLEAAYDDPGGVTAAFNRNILHVLNRELGTGLDAEAFEHRAFYDAEAGRIEMHLVATRDQVARVPGGECIEVAEGESIRTEISCKYDRRTVGALFDRAALELVEWRTDAEELFAVARGAPV